MGFVYEYYRVAHVFTFKTAFKYSISRYLYSLVHNAWTAYTYSLLSSLESYVLPESHAGHSRYIECYVARIHTSHLTTND